ncbi:MAG: LysM peptidoglycan-binding domain-containing protein [Spirochaetaceae bacterium]|jgi:LysM repeat protein|nr:LysM peptidoglycan-binding domain-containing protein [Spirochaetaceae bacterium]
MAATIGIKIANGDFFSILEENSHVKKRLILTTVHDSQESMQIDLYRSLMHSMTDSQYIGSIVVENIKPRLKGDPSIELVISSNENGELAASAMDLDSSANAEHLHLIVSLKSLDVGGQDFDIPDFELDQSELPPQGLYEKASLMREKKKKKKMPWILIIIIGLAIILTVLAVWFFLLRSGPSRARPVPRPAAERPARTEEPAPAPRQPAGADEPAPRPAAEQPAKTEEPAPAPVLVIEPAEPAQSAQDAPAPAVSRRGRSSAPVSSYNTPAVIPRNGVAYRIRWGDTLWDISEAFYRNPWLYSRIARYNGIRNPDLIISGTTIRIPPRN